MELISGIKLYTDLPFLNSQLEINNGTIAGINLDKNHPIDYRIGSIVPKNNWRQLFKEELQILIDPENEENERFGIFYGKLPSELVEIFLKLKLNNFKTRDEVLKKIKSSEKIIQKFDQKLKSILTSHSSLKDFEFHKMVFAQPNIYTLTYFAENDKLEFIGLHYDRSTIFDIKSAAFSKDRFCVNLGNQSRDLFFINLPLNTITTLIEKTKGYNGEEITLDNLIEYYALYCYDYPVIKLTLNPFEYYIAPTDNILHDGSTLKRNSLDITLVYLGHFDKKIS